MTQEQNSVKYISFYKNNGLRLRFACNFLNLFFHFMSLEELRKKIDEIDHQLVKLLNERAQVVVEIGKLKNKTDKPIYAPDREKDVLARIAEVNAGPLPDRCLVAIWRELMSGSFFL